MDEVSQLDPLTVRRAGPLDAEPVRALIARSAAFAGAWPWDEYMEQEPFVVACSSGRLRGAILAWPDAGPVAWVRLAVLEDGVDAGRWVDMSLPLLCRPLRRMGARVLAWMDAGGWLGSVLRDRFFHPFARLVTLRKRDRWLPPAEQVEAQVRSIVQKDIPSLVPLDRVVFTPPWWLSGETLLKMHRESPCFLLAHYQGQPVGYVSAHWTEYGAHIGRLAVSPALQGRGVGSLLLTQALVHLWNLGVREVTLNTQVDNRTARHLYTRFGFHPVGIQTVVWGRGI